MPMPIWRRGIYTVCQPAQEGLGATHVPVQRNQALKDINVKSRRERTSALLVS